jgi:hypothetical protein
LINDRGEMAKALPRLPGGITLQCAVLADRVIANGVMTVSEITFSKREAIALALQILDEVGCSAEVRERVR